MCVCVCVCVCVRVCTVDFLFTYTCTCRGGTDGKADGVCVCVCVCVMYVYIFYLHIHVYVVNSCIRNVIFLHEILYTHSRALARTCAHSLAANDLSPDIITDTLFFVASQGNRSR